MALGHASKYCNAGSNVHRLGCHDRNHDRDIGTESGSLGVVDLWGLDMTATTAMPEAVRTGLAFSIGSKMSLYCSGTAAMICVFLGKPAIPLRLQQSCRTLPTLGTSPLLWLRKMHFVNTHHDTTQPDRAANLCPNFGAPNVHFRLWQSCLIDCKFGISPLLHIENFCHT